jgi:hypothetical protein
VSKRKKCKQCESWYNGGHTCEGRRFQDVGTNVTIKKAADEVITAHEDLLSRLSNPGEGVKFDQDKPATHLLPPRALLEEAYVWGFGSKKYTAFNWKKGFTTLRICGAIMRHTMAIMSGEDLDPESGRHHAAHVRCCAAMLIEFYYEGRGDLDDRPTKV